MGAPTLVVYIGTAVGGGSGGAGFVVWFVCVGGETSPYPVVGVEWDGDVDDEVSVVIDLEPERGEIGEAERSLVGRVFTFSVLTSRRRSEAPRLDTRARRAEAVGIGEGMRMLGMGERNRRAGGVTYEYAGSGAGLDSSPSLIFVVSSVLGNVDDDEDEIEGGADMELER